MMLSRNKPQEFTTQYTVHFALNLILKQVINLPRQDFIQVIYDGKMRDYCILLTSLSSYSFGPCLVAIGT